MLSSGQICGLEPRLKYNTRTMRSHVVLEIEE